MSCAPVTTIHFEGYNSPTTPKRGRKSMGARQRISRRQALAISAAAGSLAIGLYREVAAQAQKRIERYSPELDGIISSSEPIQELASGTGGTLGPTEGPLWWKEGGYLLYSDIHNNRA
jgi:hypothetical protein